MCNIKETEQLGSDLLESVALQAFNSVKLPKGPEGVGYETRYVTVDVESLAIQVDVKIQVEWEDYKPATLFDEEVPGGWRLLNATIIDIEFYPEENPVFVNVG